MKASFDGARKQLAGEFNELARSGLSVAQRDIMERMRMTIIGLLCMYDEADSEDCHNLVNDVRLENIP